MRGFEKTIITAVQATNDHEADFDRLMTEWAIHG
jgi:hypothetical protein